VIVTFYSFKGGVGRSMALANVARAMQMAGLDVAVVDWDLEAPGIESFYFDRQAAEVARARPGVLDLLVDYLEMHDNLGLDAIAERSGQLALLSERLPPMRHLLLELAAPPTGPDAPQPGKLRLLGAGRREGDRFADYANAVQSLDWQRLYAQHHGLAYFDWLRERLEECGDIVLVDSRTGVTEMGGVCTRQLADVVVAFVAPNRQNLEGTIRMVQSFRRPSLAPDRLNRPLEVLMVPTRIDMTSDIKEQFVRDFAPAAEPHWPSPLRSAATRSWDLRVPYISKYAYEELLAVGASDGDSDLQAAYGALAASLAGLAPAGSRLPRRLRGELVRVFGAEFARARVQAEELLQQALGGFDDDARARAASLLARFVIVAPEREQADLARQVDAEEFDEGQHALVKHLLAEGVLRRAGGKRGLLALASDDMAKAPSLREVLDARRPYWLWRQELSAAVLSWARREGDPGALLPARLVEEAVRQRDAHPPHDLLDIERRFIAESEAEAVRQREQAERAAQTQVAQQRVEDLQARLDADQRKWVETSRRTRRWTALAIGSVLIGAAVKIGWDRLLPSGSTPPVSTGPDPSALARAAELAALGRKQAETDPLQAVMTYAEALKLDPRSRDALFGRAVAYSALGDREPALTDLSTLIELSPADNAARLERARHYIARGESDLARTDLQMQAPIATELQVERGLLLERIGEDDMARLAYDAAVDAMGSNRADALFARGSLKERLGDRAAAIADYRSALDAPGSEAARLAARARLERLDPRSTPVRPGVGDLLPVTYMVGSALASGIAQRAAERLDASRFRPRVVRYETANALAPIVDYSSATDRDAAVQVRTQTELALAKSGFKVSFELRRLEGDRERREIRVFLPDALFNPRGAPPNPKK
jgi:tetratricopeptide (TPR) repeat protein